MLLYPPEQLLLNKFFDLIISYMRPTKIQNGPQGPQNGWDGLERCLSQTNFFDPKKIFGPKFCLDWISLVKFFLDTNFFGTKKIDQNSFWTKFSLTNFFFWRFLGPTTLVCQKKFRPKIFLTKMSFGSAFFSTNIFLTQNFFGSRP